MTDREIERAARRQERRQVVRDAKALQLVGAAVAVAVAARKDGIFLKRHYRVPVEVMDRLIDAARDAGFKV